MHKDLVYIIDPPCFQEFDTERNIYYSDSIIAFLGTLNKDREYVIYRDYSFFEENVLKLFEDLKRLMPKKVFLNLSDYDILSNSHIAVGIKKFCPNCTLIVGSNLNIKERLSFNDDVLDSIDEYFDYTKNDLSEAIYSDFLSFIDMPFVYNFCNAKEQFCPIFYGKCGFLDSSKYLKNLNPIFFSFRFFKKCSLSDFKTYLDRFLNLRNNKKFKFIVDGDNFSEEEIKNLSILKKYGLMGIVFSCNDFNKACKYLSFCKGLNVKILLRFPCDDFIKDIYNIAGSNVYVEFGKRYDIVLDNFLLNKQLFMLDFLNKRTYTKNSLNYGLVCKFNPFKRFFYRKYIKYLYRETKWKKGKVYEGS